MKINHEDHMVQEALNPAKFCKTNCTLLKTLGILIWLLFSCVLLQSAIFLKVRFPFYGVPSLSTLIQGKKKEKREKKYSKTQVPCTYDQNIRKFVYRKKWSSTVQEYYCGNASTVRMTLWYKSHFRQLWRNILEKLMLAFVQDVIWNKPPMPF